MRIARAFGVPLTLALLLVTIIPIGAGIAAASSPYAANCTVNVRTRPTTLSTIRLRITRGTQVTATVVSGGSYEADCGRWVSGRTWLAITAIGGRSVRSMTGASVLYSAAGLYHAVATAPSGPIYGIDVSQWNGPIDFARVKASGRRFVIARASAGRLITDPTYARNKAAAMAAGLAFTAYHYAYPDRSWNDARLEAVHFVAVARLQRGMLIPALDLETHGTLNRTQLLAWVKTWLTTVTSKTGVRPMIYTTQGFWSYWMGNTQWFAQNGYRVLWIAHWGVSSPAVPASSWAGHSWSIWQYSDCGRVSGVSSRCTDLDRFGGTSLSAITWR